MGRGRFIHTTQQYKLCLWLIYQYIFNPQQLRFLNHQRHIFGSRSVAKMHTLCEIKASRCYSQSNGPVCSRWDARCLWAYECALTSLVLADMSACRNERRLLKPAVSCTTQGPRVMAFTFQSHMGRLGKRLRYLLQENALVPVVGATAVHQSRFM